MLYYQTPKTQTRLVIRTKLIPTVLTRYHELPFTAHQGVSRTGIYEQKILVGHA